MKNVFTRINTAFKRRVPIVTWSTSDPAQSISGIIEATAAKGAMVIVWDIADGYHLPEQPNYSQAIEAFAKLDEEQFNETEMLREIRKLPEGFIVIVMNAHAFIDQPAPRQAIWNLRDSFKGSGKMVVLMGPSVKVPVELEHDVVELDEPLPTREELVEVVRSLATDNGFTFDDDQLSKTADAASGLTSFAAEQYAAINFSKDGVDTKGVWADKCQKISETPGLKVVSEGKSFKDVAGVESFKAFVSRILAGRDAPNTIVFIDEIEKALGGASGDTSGTSQDQLGVILQWMQDNAATGCILVGPPGAAKSAMAKAAGGEAGIPTIQLDLGDMKDKLVGSSEARIRDGLKVVKSVSSGKTMWLATCNSLSNLPPELKRRFKFGTWFFDLPNAEERAAIWALYCEKYGLDAPSDKLLGMEWTGAEIESCCEMAWRMDTTAEETADYVVPVSKTAAREIDGLREQADGRFLNASAKGVYQRGVEPKKAASRRGRKLDV